MHTFDNKINCIQVKEITMSLYAIHCRAHGRVQGVGFRFFVRQKAVSLGIRGLVRNLSDGTVEIHAEGEQQPLKEFIERVEAGPVFGNVSELAVEWIHPTNDYTGFEITF